MPETHQARIGKSRVIETITDDEPLKSVAPFWRLSDEIWSRRPSQWDLSAFSLQSLTRVNEMRDRLNEVLADVDPLYVVSGASQDRIVTGTRGQKTRLPAAFINNPARFTIGTFNFDDRCTSRVVEVDGETTGAHFTDGHVDKYRELYAGFTLTDNDSLAYSMQRTQWGQGYPTHLLGTLRSLASSEQGDDGNRLAYREVSIEQESRLLDVFKAMADVAINNPA